MGSLKPGATYIYERVGKVVYAREAGARPETRQVIGWDYDPDNKEFKNWSKKFTDEYLWNEILESAEGNPALQEALERVKIIYYLSKQKNGT
jgi:hypothetical protein